MRKWFSWLERQARRSLRAACLVCGAHARHPICPTCLAHWLSEYSWTGCARCGRNECIDCGILAGFLNVNSLFRLDGAAARLLLDAKDRDDVLAQNLISELCRLALPRRMRGLDHAISHVVISPLRLDRLGEAPWHPVLPLVDGARDLGAPVLAPHVRGVRRQTTLTARERTGTPGNGELIFGWSDKKALGSKPEGVLFLDDVLTTGGVAERTRRLFPEPFREVPWSVVTLFRTPVARLMKVEPDDLTPSRSARPC